MMRKLFLGLCAALCMSFAGCEKLDVDLVRQVVVADKTYQVSEMETSFSQESGEYFFSSSLEEVPNVYVGGFDQSLLGKELSLTKSDSGKTYWFALNGYHEISDDLFVNTNDLFCRNENGNFITGFKSGHMKVYEYDGNLVIEVTGTLEKGVHFEYRNYVDKSKVVSY